MTVDGCILRLSPDGAGTKRGNEMPRQQRIQLESNEVQADVQIKLERIKALLETDAKETQTWGHVANLEKVSSDLDEVIDFLN
jgi:hypothetical protein